MNRSFAFETALAGLGRQAVARARTGKEPAIEARLRAHADELRVRVAEQIARKPDPGTWTPDEHATFILATEASPKLGSGSAAGADVQAAPPEPRPAASVHSIDAEIPF